MVLSEQRLHLKINIGYLLIEQLIDASYFIIKLFLLRIEPKLVDLLNIVLHFVIAYFLLEHKLQVRPINFTLYHPFDVGEGSS